MAIRRPVKLRGAGARAVDEKNEARSCPISAAQLRGLPRMSSRSRRGLCNSDVNIRGLDLTASYSQCDSQLKTCHCWSVHLPSRRSELQGWRLSVVPSQRIVSPRKAASVGPFANTRSSNIWNRLTNPESRSHSIVLNSIEKAVRNLRRSCYTNI